MTGHQAWEREMGRQFAEAVRALFSRHVQSDFSKQEPDCQLGAVRGAVTVRTERGSEMTKP